MKKKMVFVCTVLAALLLAALPGGAQEAFTGSWTGETDYNGVVRRYDIVLRDGGGCTVRVTVPAGGVAAAQEAEGFWSYGDAVFRVNASFPTPVLPALRSIRWASVAVFGTGGNSFNILIPPDSYRQEKVRVTFYRETVSRITGATARSFEALSKDIPPGARVAVVNIAAADPEEGAMLVDEVTLAFVNARRFTVVERKDIDTVLGEQHFQMSGYVDDDSAVSIGKFLGAAVVITGGVIGTGARKRLVLKAIDVLTAEILAMSQETL
jgi:hypothetical protein